MADFIVTGAQVFDGIDVVPGASVLVRGSRIEGVGDLPVPEGVEVVDGRGATLLPGLIDNHSHVCPPVLETSLAFGVTTEIDLFSFPDWMVPLKAEAARRNDMADVRSCMYGVTVHGGHPSSMIGRYFPYEFPTVADASQIPSFVAARIAEGADCIKLFIDDGRAVGHSSPTMTQEMARVVVEEAHGHGVLCLAHIASIDGARQAIEAGVDGLAHVPRDVAPTAEIVELIAAAGVFVTPTLGLVGNLTGQLPSSDLVDGTTAPRLTDTERHNFCAGNEPDDPVHYEYARQATGELHRAGVDVLAGTDVVGVGLNGTSHGLSLHQELSLIIGCGVSTLDAIRGVTGTSACRWRMDDRGRIAPGRQADLLLVDGDPLSDVTDLLRIRDVWRRGTRFDRKTYEANRGERERLSAQWATKPAA